MAVNARPGAERKTRPLFSGGDLGVVGGRREELGFLTAMELPRGC